MQTYPLVPQRLRCIASTVLIGNEIFWSDVKLGLDELGNDVYLGICPDTDSQIRNTWTKLAEVVVKESNDTFCPKGTQVKWGLYYNRCSNGDCDFQNAYFVQLTHRVDGSTYTVEDEQPGDLISH